MYESSERLYAEEHRKAAERRDREHCAVQCTAYCAAAEVTAAVVCCADYALRISRRGCGRLDLRMVERRLYVWGMYIGVIDTGRSKRCDVYEKHTTTRLCLYLPRMASVGLSLFPSVIDQTG